MKLTFLGTRGLIEPRTARHARHSSLQVGYRGQAVMIDCGEGWREELFALNPRAIVVTHAHPDHAFGLRDGAPCPVWATEPAWQTLADFPIAQRRILQPRQPQTIRGITFEAFSVQHSVRAPAVGYRITAGRATIFYAPDLVYIHEREEALRDCRLYIGDGATVSDSMVRRNKAGELFGHTPVRTQLTWCREEGVPKMLVSHCGSEIVTGEDTGVAEEIRGYAEERGVEVEIAYDGLEVVLR